MKLRSKNSFFIIKNKFDDLIMPFYKIINIEYRFQFPVINKLIENGIEGELVFEVIICTLFIQVSRHLHLISEPLSLRAC